MSLTQEQQKAKELMASVIAKAWEDENFKKELIANPTATIAKFTGSDLKDTGKNVVVADQSDADTVYINIPNKPNFDDIELTEDQLELVAGGGDPILDWVGENIALPAAIWIVETFDLV